MLLRIPGLTGWGPEEGPAEDDGEGRQLMLALCLCHLQQGREEA
jgi:hypothetical protein